MATKLILVIVCAAAFVSPAVCKAKMGASIRPAQAAPVSNPECGCKRIYKPVCADGVTYSNDCEAECAGKKSFEKGACKVEDKCKEHEECCPNSRCMVKPKTKGPKECMTKGKKGYEQTPLKEDGCPKPCMKIKCKPGLELQGQDDRGCGGKCVCNCRRILAPVCGMDGKDYNNECLAGCAGQKVKHDGKCALCEEDGECCPGSRCMVKPRTKGPKLCLSRKGKKGYVQTPLKEEGCPKPCLKLKCNPGQEVQGADEQGCGGKCVCNCQKILAPVCGMDGKNYDNKCLAGCAGQKVMHNGKCALCKQDEDCCPNSRCMVKPRTKGPEVCLGKGKKGYVHTPLKKSGGCPKPCKKLLCKKGFELQGADERGCGGECVKVCNCPKTTKILAPVCAMDGETYGSDCLAKCADQKKWYAGRCKPDLCKDDKECCPGSTCMHPRGFTGPKQCIDRGDKPALLKEDGCGKCPEGEERDTMQDHKCVAVNCKSASACPRMGKKPLICRDMPDKKCVRAPCKKYECVVCKKVKCPKGFELQGADEYGCGGKCARVCICPTIEKPVCGVDGITYGNSCKAKCAGKKVVHNGKCALCEENEECCPGSVCAIMRGTRGPKRCLSRKGKKGYVHTPLKEDGICPKPCLKIKCKRGFELQGQDEHGCGGQCVKPCICQEIYMPVCGMDGETYSNKCKAGCAGQKVMHNGKCALCKQDEDCCPDSRCMVKPRTKGPKVCLGKGKKGYVHTPLKRDGCPEKPCLKIKCPKGTKLQGADEKTGCGGECVKPCTKITCPKGTKLQGADEKTGCAVPPYTRCVKVPIKPVIPTPIKPESSLAENCAKKDGRECSQARFCRAGVVDGKKTCLPKLTKIGGRV